MTKRPETGPMQFGDDWPGLFIRGDQALYFGVQLALVLKNLPDTSNTYLAKSTLMGLADDLLSCDTAVADPTKIQYAQVLDKVTELKRKE